MDLRANCSIRMYQFEPPSPLGDDMASTAPTAAADTLNLTPPDPVPPVAPEKAAGLVPLDEEKRSKLDEKVDAFIDDLVAQDANSPEFGQRVDQLTNMGRKEIAEAEIGRAN